MRFKEWLERTIYHGTVVDNEPTIKKFGLVGGYHSPVGAFVGDAYGGDYEGVEPNEDDEVVFAADKGSLGKAVNAMVFHIGRKLRKDFHDVSDNDIRNHGLLVMVKGTDKEPYDPAKWQDSVPRGVEPGDYYDSEMGADAMIRGSALLRFLKRNGEWPRDFGVDSGGRWKIRAGWKNARIAKNAMMRDIYGYEPSPSRPAKKPPFNQDGMPSFLDD